MKSTLNLPWNLLRDVGRWLQTFNINLEPEGKCRAVAKDWLADSIRSEEIPALVLRKNIISIELCVLRYLNDLKSNNKLYDHPFIPQTEIQLGVSMVVTPSKL